MGGEFAFQCRESGIAEPLQGAYDGGVAGAAGGAQILREPEDQPFGRLYSAADLEGHRWMFMQPS